MTDPSGRLALEVTSAITWYMRQNSISRRDLASRLGVTPGRVSQILTGGQNLTLRTLESIEDALGADLEVSLKSRENLKDADSETVQAWS